jgi:hypothetical protein
MLGVIGSGLVLLWIEWVGWKTWRRPTLPRLETQYHGRWGFSRPSSGWDRVGGPRHGHQVIQPTPWFRSRLIVGRETPWRGALQVLAGFCDVSVWSAVWMIAAHGGPTCPAGCCHSDGFVVIGIEPIGRLGPVS